MGISRGGGAMFRRIPVWLNIVGGLILVTQVSTLAILPFASDDGGTTNGGAVVAKDKSTVTVLYLLTGTAKNAYTVVTNDTGGEETVREQAVPMRRPYEMRKGAETRVYASADDGDLTCTLVMDGIIVAQQRGTKVSCAGDAGEEKAHSGAVMPTEEQLLPKPAPDQGAGQHEGDEATGVPR